MYHRSSNSLLVLLSTRIQTLLFDLTDQKDAGVKESFHAVGQTALFGTGEFRGGCPGDTPNKDAANK